MGLVLELPASEPTESVSSGFSDLPVTSGNGSEGVVAGEEAKEGSAVRNAGN